MIIYPPLIADIIPAFTASEVKIPFENNPAVVLSSVKGFRLIVKDYNSSKIIAYSKADYTTDIVNEVTFTNFQSNEETFAFTSGNYYKFQIAYYDNDEDTTFYYSSASIGRCVEKEKNIYITGSNIPLANETPNPDIYGIYRGVYESDMLSEPLYSYQFILKDNKNQIYQDSGILNFDNSKDYAGLYSTEFKIKKELKDDVIYTLQFFVTTINGYQASSIQYQIIKAVRPAITTNIQLSITKVDYENGYVELKLSGVPNSAAKVQIERQSDNSEIWDVMAKYNALGNKEVNFTWKDLSIEQGISYKYALVQSSENATGEILYYSERKIIGSVIPDFENMFLADGNKQLKIKFDPKVSNFKDTILESKVDTIGGQYPFFFRNGDVRYKEIPISGLISYQMDRDNFFINDEELSLFEKSSLRNRTNSPETFDNAPTTSLVGYNYTAERKFKLAVLEWLTDGKPKLFRSPSEGNYVVRLMNTSLSPNDTLGRMIHSFSCTGYECAAADIESLQASGLIPQPEIIEPELQENDWKIFSALYKDINWKKVSEDNTLATVVSLEDLITIEEGKMAVVTEIKWELTKPSLFSSDYLSINGGTFLNPTGVFITPEDYYINTFSLYREEEPLNETASITFKYIVKDIAVANNYIDNFATSVNNGLDVVVSIPINTTVQEVFKDVKPLTIYTAIARRDINANDNDNFNLTIDNQTFDLSDGQIRFYRNIGFNIEKGNGIHLDLYIRISAEAVKENPTLGNFIFGYSKLGVTSNV